MNVKMDRDTALRLLTEVVAEFGSDFVYPDKWRNDSGNCRYVRPDDSSAPACIVGQVLHRWGVSLYMLSSVEGKSPMVGELRRVLTTDAAFVLNAAQSVQDEGGAWGRALTAAYAAAGHVS